MVADCDDVSVLQRVLLDQFTVDICAVGAVQVFQERVVENIDDQRVMSADCRIVDANIVIRKTPDGVAFLGHVVFSQDLIVQT